MRPKDRPNNTFAHGLSLKAKKQRMTEKSFVAGRLLVVRDWYVKGRLAFTCVLLEADAINVPTVLLLVLM